MLKPEIVFTDHMVLQRNKNIRVFGEGDEGSKVTVILNRKDKAYKAETRVRDGRFEVILPKQTATKRSESLTMEVFDKNTRYTFSDIAVGEVWLAGGQSNMELELQNAEGGKDILNKELFKKDVRNKLRYFYTPKLSYKDDEYEENMRKASWCEYSKENAACWSAVAFYFASRLAKKLDVTIGIIGCNWGGTLACNWMSRDYLISLENTREYVDNYESSEDFKKSEEKQLEEYRAYQRYQEEWDKKSQEVYKTEPMISWDDIQKKIGPCQYPGPTNCANFTRPYGLYETMVKRLVPYTIAGVIYYQGESDEGKPENYYDLQTLLIKQWRKDFKDSQLPFIITQLPMHRYQHDPDTKSWCILREAQMQVAQDMKNVSIAVIIDCGIFHQIHPPKKTKVGKRLADQALFMVYKEIGEDNAYGPVYKDYLYENDGIRVFFDHAEDGFKLKKSRDYGFEIAGADGNYVKAKAHFYEDGSVLLTNHKVKEVQKARYLWSNYMEVFVFGKNGYPMAPFRTHKE